MLAAFTGYEVIARVPVILHTPLMSGSNFVHGIVLVGAMVALGGAQTPLEKAIGFVGVLLAAGNAVGGYVVTERMLEMFKASGTRVAMTNMPQMIALYNGMGGGAAAAIAAVELYRGGTAGYVTTTLAVAGGIIGAVSFSGSAVAFGKLQGLITRSLRFGGQQLLNLLLLAAALTLGALG